MAEISELVDMLRDILRHETIPMGQVRAFQEAVWETPETDDDPFRWDLLIELATDMEYYVPDPDLRREHRNYFGHDRLIEKIRSTLKEVDQVNPSPRDP